MMPTVSPILARIDLDRIICNARAIKARTGVELLPVIKADAYGFGAQKVAVALREVADRFCGFSLDEAERIGLQPITGKEAIALGPPDIQRADEYIARHVRPVVWNIEQARGLRAARPILNIDTAMQRFACPSDQVDAVMAAGAIDEAITHTTTISHV